MTIVQLLLLMGQIKAFTIYFLSKKGLQKFLVNTNKFFLFRFFDLSHSFSSNFHSSH